MDHSFDNSIIGMLYRIQCIQIERFVERHDTEIIKEITREAYQYLYTATEENKLLRAEIASMRTTHNTIHTNDFANPNEGV